MYSDLTYHFCIFFSCEKFIIRGKVIFTSIGYDVKHLLLLFFFKSISDRPEPPTYISYEPGRDLAFVYRICVKYQEDLKRHKENVCVCVCKTTNQISSF